MDRLGGPGRSGHCPGTGAEEAAQESQLAPVMSSSLSMLGLTPLVPGAARCSHLLLMWEEASLQASGPLTSWTQWALISARPLSHHLPLLRLTSAMLSPSSGVSS